MNRSPRKMMMLYAAAFVLSSATALADTVILKSGEKIEGKIIEETPAGVTVEYNVSAGITDTRTVPKAEVEKVEKITPDVQQFAALKGLKPGANSLPAASYEPTIKALQAFVAQFPQSAHAAEAQQQLAAFEAEKKRVDGGEVKLNNQWLTKEEAQKERYQINGQVILSHLQGQIQRGDFVGAMNSFIQLETNYKGARTYPDAVEAVKQILPRLKAVADQTLRQWQQTRAQREQGIQLAREPEKSEMIAANEREQKNAEALVAQAASQGLRYPPFLGNSEKALTEISARASEDAQRLAQVQVAPMRQSIQLAEKAREQIAKGEFDAADATLSSASSAWNENEMVARLQTENGAKRTAANTPPPEPAAEQPAPTEPMPADPAAPAAASGTAPAAGATPAPPTVQQATGEEQPAPEEEEREPGFFATPFGWIVTIVLLAFAYAAFKAYKKVQNKANEIIE